MKYLILYIIVPAVVCFLIQSILCYKVENGILRHATLVLPLVFVAIGGVTLLTQCGDIFGGLGAIAAVLWFVTAFSAALGYGAAWLLFYLRGH